MGFRVWLDVKQDDKSEKGMEEGVRGSMVFLAMITGHIINPDRPDDDPVINAYFSRTNCIKELNWAIDSAKKIQPLILSTDKSNISDLLGMAPPEYKFLGSIDFITIDRNDIEHFEVDMRKILKQTVILAFYFASVAGILYLLPPSSSSPPLPPYTHTHTHSYTRRWAGLRAGPLDLLLR